MSIANTPIVRELEKLKRTGKIRYFSPPKKKIIEVVDVDCNYFLVKDEGNDNYSVVCEQDVLRGNLARVTNFLKN